MDANDYIDGIHWYVVHTYSGYENKVKTNLEKIVENRSLQELIYDIKIPTVTEVQEQGDQSKEVEVKLYPSYVMIKMIMNDFTWHIIRNITGVTGFVGSGATPAPLTDAEAEAMGVDTRIAPAALAYGVGDSVSVKSGPFQGFVGRVEEISDDQKTVRILASMFGRETPVEIEAENIELLKF